MKPIESHAIIGDGRSTALVTRSGSIDWLCWPRLDGPSIFGAILDPTAGTWSLRALGSPKTTRRYLDRTNVLETRFETTEGVLRLTDLMPVREEEDKSSRLAPEHEIVRTLRCDQGAVEVEAVFDPRPDYGRARARFRPAGAFGLRCDLGSSVMYLNSTVAWTADEDGVWRARFTMREGDEHFLSLTLARDGPAVIPPLGDDLRERIWRTIEWWRHWVGRCRYSGPGREAVIRSALVLKLLSFAPSGAIIAAPTTSLPERIGGGLNWDYRYCWLRDASMTARALFGLGFNDEAEAFVSWLLHSTRLTRRHLRVLYDVFGRSPGREGTLDHLSGWRDSRPVRIGNAAEDQLQLDVYGEVLEAVAHFVESGGKLDRETASMIVKFGRIVCRRWREPDEGLWEPRTGRAPHTHSRLLCWVALDRLLALGARGLLPRLPADEFRSEREKIRQEIEARAWSERLQSYVGTLDSEVIDSAVLLMPWYGFKDAGSPRMLGTYARIRTAL